MNRDDIIRMGKEAGMLRAGENWTMPAHWGIDELVRFAAFVEMKVRGEYKLIASVAGGAGPRTLIHPCVNYVLPKYLALYARVGEATATERYTTAIGEL